MENTSPNMKNIEIMANITLKINVEVSKGAPGSLLLKNIPNKRLQKPATIIQNITAWV